MMFQNIKASPDHDKCSLCGVIFLPTNSTVLESPDGDRVEVPKFSTVTIIVDGEAGDVVICENCYRKIDFSKYSPDEIVEIHYNFAIEFYHEKRFPEGMAAIQNALLACRSIPLLNMFALYLSHSGNKHLERECYNLILALDPNDFLARENLKNFLSKL